MRVALRAYLALAALSGPLWRWAVRRRVARGKEDAARVGERWGQASAPRPKGPLLWVHALGIGEAAAMLAVIRAVQAARPDVAVLLTTGTRTGADGLARMGLPAGVIHQYAPVDATAPVARFLDHWRPDMMLLAELDLWPLMLSRLEGRGVPMVMANARLTDKRFRGRMRMRPLMRDVLALFDAVLVQDALTAMRMNVLGADPAKVTVAGLLKAGAAPLPDRLAERQRLGAALAGRPVWLAAATHAQETAAMLAAHQVVLAALPEALLILAPRQLTDADHVAQAVAESYGAVARRSLGDTPQGAVFLADTMGEMGLWYRLAPVAFVGHSLAVDGAALTGKNPFEAVALGCAVLHGPCVTNFADSYAALGDAGLVDSAGALGAAVLAMLGDDDLRGAQVAQAAHVLAREQAALPATLAAVLPHLGHPIS